MQMSEKTTGTETPVGHPSFCIIKPEFTEKTDSFVYLTNNFLKIDFLQNDITNLSI